MSELINNQQSIDQFNRMMRMPAPDWPTRDGVGDPVQRLLNFSKIMREELEEVDTLIALCHGRIEGDAVKVKAQMPEDTTTDELFWVMLMDWLGDIEVYAASEARRWGITQLASVAFIMKSNFTKLNEDGTATYDQRGELLKSKNYVTPEPMLLKFLRDCRKAEATMLQQAQSVTEVTDVQPKDVPPVQPALAPESPPMVAIPGAVTNEPPKA